MTITRFRTLLQQEALLARGFDPNGLDGIEGRGTRSALRQAYASAYPPAPAKETPAGELSQSAFDLIVHFEIGSPTYYSRHLQRASYPGGASGVTIGIGYDLGYNTRERIKADWGGKVSTSTLKLLLAAAGLKRGAAKAFVARHRNRIVIPLEVAEDVFQESTLPRFIRLTARTFPGSQELLPANTFGALVSLVFNRGSSLKGHRRRHMAAIAQNIAKLRNGKQSLANAIGRISAEISSMQVIWRGKNLPGLLRRRRAESKLALSLS